jgi:hypothetical protein
MTDQVPDTQDGNPFSLIAYVLFKVRHALEDPEQANKPPRWIRISRGSPYKGDLPLGPIVKGAVNGMAEALSYMVELTLDIEELLYQTDAAKAMAEVMLRLVQAASDQDFQDGIEALVGTDSLGELGSAMNAINNAAQDVEQYLDYIPDPEDVRGMGHELYRLLAIVQPPPPRTATNTIDISDSGLKGTEHLDVDECGKIRLCAWAYEEGVTARGLGPNEGNSKELFRLGSRRLYKTTSNVDLPQKAEHTWSAGEDRVRVFSFDFASTDEKKQFDIKELIELLEAHDYKNSPSMRPSPGLFPDTITENIRQNLMKFQAINELPITGEVDNETLNRLNNLDYGRKNLRRAKPYDASFAFPWPQPQTQPPPPKPVSDDLEIINPGADNYSHEGLGLQKHAQHPRKYYVVPTRPADMNPSDVNNWPKGRGWLRDESVGTVPGFVALYSRGLNPSDDAATGRLEGGRFSEGEAASGSKFFWAARHTEPWLPGRTGTPGPDALFGGTQPTPGSISRMFQWIPMPTWLDPNIAANHPDNSGGWELYVFASVLQRSLFTDRNRVTNLPDQGRIVLELYGSDVFQSTTSSRGVTLGAIDVPWYPEHQNQTGDMPVTDVDRSRLWVPQKTGLLKVPVDADPAKQVRALCLVVEGKHQSAYDIDAYFDALRVGYLWKKPSAP